MHVDCGWSGPCCSASSAFCAWIGSMIRDSTRTADLMRPCGLCIQTISTVAPARFDGWQLLYSLRCRPSSCTEY